MIVKDDCSYLYANNFYNADEMDKFLENIEPIKPHSSRNGNPELYNYNILNQFYKIFSQWLHRPVGFTDEFPFLSLRSQKDELRA